MSVILSRSALEPIGMNEVSGRTRRSARLSQDGEGEHNATGKTTATTNGAIVSTTTTTSTKLEDGSGKANGRKKRKVYEQEVEGFSFSRGKRSKASSKAAETPPSVENNTSKSTDLVSESGPATKDQPVNNRSATDSNHASRVVDDAPPPTTAQKKGRRKLPTTPEHEAAGKTVRRSKRLSDEQLAQASPTRATTSRAPERSPSPERARPVTVEKKRVEKPTAVLEERAIKIVLPFADTPIIRRNKEMRKGSGDGHRRSSSGMRGRRASSMMEEGRGTALPHSEVPAAEFYKHISAELTEPRRMRCLLSWCGTRALPAKTDPPAVSRTKISLDDRAAQIARTVQEDLSQDLISKGILSDWFSRDESVPPAVALKKKANPRNIINAKKAEEMELELQRLQAERAEWDQLLASVDPATTLPPSAEAQGALSPLRPELLDSSQRDIFTQLTSNTMSASASNPEHITRRLKDVAENLEFAVDSFADGIHALSAARKTAERIADRSLADAANVLDAREKRRVVVDGKAVEQMDILRGLARLLNAQQKRA